MGVERRAALGRTKKASPPYFSHEFIISNHGDIMSCVIMLIVVGLMFQVTLPFSQMLIVPQYNTTFENNSLGGQVFYKAGVRDIGAFFFYTIVWITVHCIIQEYIVDKIQRRLHMSRSRLMRFSESSQLGPFSVYSLCHAGYLLYELGVHKDFSLLWVGYPEAHRYLSLSYKLFFILQISFWIHQFPEFYFQKLRKEEIRERTIYSILFLGFVVAAYFTNLTRLALVLLTLEYTSLSLLHFTRLIFFANKQNPSASNYFQLWNISFIFVRLASMVVSVFVLFYGLRAKETPYIDYEKGNFNTHLIRLNALFFLLAIQIYLIYNFARFHCSRWSTHSKQEHQQQKRNKYAKGKKHAPEDKKLN